MRENIDRASKTLAGGRVPGLPRDYARSHNNRVTGRAKLSAIDVTAKAFFERLYLVLGLSLFGLRVNCPYTHTPTAHSPAISRFLCNFFQGGPSFFCQHDSLSYLAESRYPPLENINESKSEWGS